MLIKQVLKSVSVERVGFLLIRQLRFGCARQFEGADEEMKLMRAVWYILEKSVEKSKRRWAVDRQNCKRKDNQQETNLCIVRNPIYGKLRNKRSLIFIHEIKKKLQLLSRRLMIVIAPAPEIFRVNSSIAVASFYLSAIGVNFLCSCLVSLRQLL